VHVLAARIAGSAVGGVCEGEAVSALEQGGGALGQFVRLGGTRVPPLPAARDLPQKDSVA